MAIGMGCPEVKECPSGEVRDSNDQCVDACELADCVDGDECTQDLCVNVDGVGKCSHPSAEPDTECDRDGGSVCDDAGSCVECNEAAHCPDDGNACTVATCDDHSCTADIIDCPPELGDTEHELVLLNNCNEASTWSTFRLQVDYEDVNGDVTQSGTHLVTDTCWSDGSCAPPVEYVSANLGIAGDGFLGSIDFYTCLSYGETDWADVTITIWDAADNESNPATTRIPRPAGAI